MIHSLRGRERKRKKKTKDKIHSENNKIQTGDPQEESSSGQHTPGCLQDLIQLKDRKSFPAQPQGPAATCLGWNSVSSSVAQSSPRCTAPFQGRQPHTESRSAKVQRSVQWFLGKQTRTSRPGYCFWALITKK